jgi:hypothetical protein
MGIDARIETERGEPLSELGDPHNRMNWLLRLAALDSTICLRFIDPYGNTTFNSLQIPVLQAELSELSSGLTETNLQNSKRAYLELANAWPKNALQDAETAMESLTLAELRQHLEDLLRLVSEATAEHHRYVRFVGD